MAQGRAIARSAAVAGINPTGAAALGPTPEVQGGFPSAPRPTALSCFPKMRLISLNYSGGGVFLGGGNSEGGRSLEGGVGELALPGDLWPRGAFLIPRPLAVVDYFCVWSQTARQDRRSEAVMAKIFLSYRREDSRGVAGRIYDRLCAHFGLDSVFFDVDSVPPGVDFPEYIELVLSHCDVFLAVIGPDWAGQINTGRRIDNPEDWVRIEIEAA